MTEVDLVAVRGVLIATVDFDCLLFFTDGSIATIIIARAGLSVPGTIAPMLGIIWRTTVTTFQFHADS